MADFQRSFSCSFILLNRSFLKFCLIKSNSIRSIRFDDPLQMMLVRRSTSSLANGFAMELSQVRCLLYKIINSYISCNTGRSLWEVHEASIILISKHTLTMLQFKFKDTKGIAKISNDDHTNN